MRARQIVAAATVASLAAGAGGAAVAATSGGATAATPAVQTGLATVVRTDLNVQDAVAGTIGYDSHYAIYGPAGTTAQAVAQLQQTATADQLIVATDRAALADAANGGDQTVNQQQVALANARSAQHVDQDHVAQDRGSQAADQHAADLAVSKQATDTARLANDTAAQRNEQVAQLADQQQLTAAQHSGTQDQAALTAALQQEAADAQGLNAAQQHVQSDQAAVASDCTPHPPTAQCTADQARLAQDQQQVAQAQTTVVSDRIAVTTDQAAVSNDQNVAAAVQHRLDDEATALLHLGFALADDQSSVQQDGTALAAATAAVTADQQKLAADTDKAGVQDGAAVSTAQAAVGVAGASAVNSLHQAQAKLDLDASALRAAQATAAAAEVAALGAGTTLTWLPRAGQTVREGDPVYALNGTPAPLLYGQTPLFRGLQEGMADGPDVGELNADLGLSQTDHFSAATATALQAWQRAHGLAPTGMLGLGSAVVEPGAFRVSAVDGAVGTPLGSTAVLEVTSTALVVTAQVPLSDVGLVSAGDAVTVDLPNGHRGVPGRIRDIGVVAPAAGGQNSQEEQQSGQQQSGQEPATSVGATVTFSDASVAQGLAQAAVLVHVTTQTVRGVLAVPVDALLALANGGEGVEVVTGTRHDIVAVRTGAFTGTQVEVSGAGLTAGAQVEVPAS
jgi:hypothetical protein